MYQNISQIFLRAGVLLQGFWSNFQFENAIPAVE
jgi:hypothetical protein